MKKQYLDQHSSEIETLILGSSHSYYGLNPVFFTSRTFNASHVSQSLNYDYKILMKYQSKLKNLNKIIIPISYFSLYGNIEVGSESWRLKNYVLYYGMKPIKITNYSEILSNNLKENLKRLYLIYYKGNSSISCSNLGWGKQNVTDKKFDLIETGKTAAKRHTNNDINALSSKKTFHDNIMVLNSILNWSKKNNVKVIFITLPAYESYRKNINILQYKETINAINDLCNTNSNCFYINTFEDDNFVQDDFYDADHLSEKGARKLSIILNQKLVKL